MTIEEAVQARLVAVLGHARVYPDGGIPQNQDTWPCWTFEHSGDDERFSLGGSGSTVRIDEFTLEGHAPERADVAAERDAIKAAHRGVNARGLWGGASGVYVTGAVARDAQADADDPIAGDEGWDRIARVTLKINWKGS